MTDTKDERITKIERAAEEWHAAWVAEPALELIGERDQRIAELERALKKERESAAWWGRATSRARRRADALERALRQIAYHPDCNYRAGTMYDLGVTDGHRCAAQIARAAFTDQPNRERAAQIAEDIGDTETAAEVRARDNQPAQDDYPQGPPDSLPAGGHARRLRPTSDQPAQDGRRLDPYTLERAAEGCDERAQERDEAQSEHPAHTFDWAAHGRMAAAHRTDAWALRNEAQRIRNLQPDQPADAGERPENWVAQEVASAEAEVSKWPAWMTGTADAGEPSKGVSLCQQISDAQERVAAWPEWMTKSAKVHEADCCARTREEERERIVAKLKRERRTRVVGPHNCTPNERNWWLKGRYDAIKGCEAAIRRMDKDVGGRDE
jgi:hypothetical protein